MGEITQEQLKEFLSYDPDTGLFVWVVTKGNKSISSVAGTTVRGGYIRIGISGKHYLAHRLAWLYVYGEFPTKYLDHINGVTNDNRVENLREATNQENQYNQGVCRVNKSGYKGVSWNKKVGKWVASGYANSKSIFLGYFSTPEEASKAYNDYAKKHHGEFYRNTRE